MANGDLASGALGWNGPVRLLKVNTSTGKISAERFLETSVWSIAFAKIPARLALGVELLSLCRDALQPG